MKIFTSYFAKVKDLPLDVVPISIVGRPPANYHGAEYKKLAPKYYSIMMWKKTHDNENYLKHFREECLEPLVQSDVVAELMTISLDKDIALISYEKNGVSHKREVAKWLREGGYEVKEYSFKKENNEEEEPMPL